MQRQSLGSPSRVSLSAVIDLSPPTTTVISVNDDGDEIKPAKPQRCRIQPENSIHLIPLLLLLSFLILYLSSYNPSPQDMAQFNRIKQAQKITDVEDIEGNNGNLKWSKVAAIESRRNLKENVKKKRKNNRKFVDF